MSAAAQGSIEVFADVPTAGDILAANNDDNELTMIIAGADIALDLTLAATAASGGLVDFVWEATNNGPDTSNGFTIAFPAPAGIVNMVPPASCCNNAGTWENTIAGPLALGGSVIRTFRGQTSAASGSDLTASASVVGQNPPDPVAANNTDTDTVTITAGTDVAIDKSRSPGGPLLTGDSVTFTLDATYTGDAPTGLTITDTIPGNYAITAINTSGGWSCPPPAGQDVACTNPGGGAAGNNTSIGSVEVVTDVVTAGSATNTATISGAGPPEQNLANNTDTDGGATITDPGVDLRANKSGPSPALVVVGNSYSYNISATNIGNADFWGTIVMQDDIPAGLTLDSVGANGWSCLPAAPLVGPATLTCTRVCAQPSPLGASATTPAVTLNTTVTGTGSLSNALAINSPDANIPDLNPGNDSTSYNVTSQTGPNSANVGTVKTANPDPVAAGQDLTYVVTAQNLDNGLSRADNVEIVDTLPPNVTYISASGSGASCSTALSSGDTTGAADTVTCDMGDIGQRSVTIVVRPNNATQGTVITNDVVVSTTTTETDLTNNSASVDVDVSIPNTDLLVNKIDSVDPAAVGDTTIYTITVTNAGPSA